MNNVPSNNSGDHLPEAVPQSPVDDALGEDVCLASWNDPIASAADEQPDTGTESASTASADSVPAASTSDANDAASPTTGEGAADASSVAPPSDAIVQQRLQQIQSGWSQPELDKWLYEEFLGPLAEIHPLTEEALVLYLDWLREGLGTAGYKPKSRAHYHGAWKTIAKAKHEDQMTQKKAAGAEATAAGQGPGRFRIRSRTLPGANEPTFLDPVTHERLSDAPPLGDFQTQAIFDVDTSEFLTNFSLLFDREVEVRDEFKPRKMFMGKLTLFGREHPFKIDAEDYADNQRFKAAITAAAGVAAVIHCSMDRLREAVSTLSWQPGHQQPVSRAVTTDFGWNADGEEFLAPSGRVTEGGFVATDEQTSLQVDLQEEELARYLDLTVLEPAELVRIKRHIVEDLLQLHDRRVTYTLLASVGAALLGRFAPDASPFILWLVGLTGAGKSFLAKLFMNFFGDFPVASGRFAAWASTFNFLQRQGYFFKDAWYLIDDYKPEVIKQDQIVRVLQNYADRQGRGRLRADATTNPARPIRGLLVCTGEDVPEHSASAVARSILIEVPQQPKDLARGSRCVSESRHYRGVTSDCIQQLLTRKRPAAFVKIVGALQRYYYRDIIGEQNDSRIAGNFALLAAGFAEMARYLSDVWPTWQKEVRWFLTKELIAIRDGMVGTSREQQASEVFWSVLGELVEHKAVELDEQTYGRNKPLIGKRVFPSPNTATTSIADDLFYISTDLALAEVNQCLRAQGRPELKVTIATLLGQLRRDGWLLDQNGQPLRADGEGAPTRQLRIEGKRRRSFVTSRRLLLGERSKVGSFAGNIQAGATTTTTATPGSAPGWPTAESSGSKQAG